MRIKVLLDDSIEGEMPSEFNEPAGYGVNGHGALQVQMAHRIVVYPAGLWLGLIVEREPGEESSGEAVQ